MGINSDPAEGVNVVDGVLEAPSKSIWEFAVVGLER